MPKINPSTSKQKIITIVGPTASGKSDLGIKLAKKLDGEIISADSRQVYKGMNLGTGKVPRDRFKIYGLRFGDGYFSNGVGHHLIDVADPKKQFTADNFKKLGQKAIDNILSRGKVPIIVGGSGFYIDVLLGRISIAEVPPNKKLRARFDKLTVERLFKMLQKLDPQRAQTVESKNKRRLIRALEIVLTTGKPIPRLEIQDSRFKILWLGLKPKNLEKKIKIRLDTRLKQGMIKEVANLRKQGLSWKRLDDLGLEYRWISRYLKSENEKEKTKTKNFKLKFRGSEYYKKLLRDIIKYSKRQTTWFKKNKEIQWIKTFSQVNQEIKKFLKS